MTSHRFISELHELPNLPWESVFGRPLCFVDIETNGTGKDAQIVGIALVRVAGQQPEKVFRTLVHARDAGASHIHDVEAADLRDAPTFEQIVPVVRELVSGSIVVAHSASFERRFLARELEALGGSWEHPMLCTLKLARRLHPERSGRGAHSQAGLCDLYGLDWGGPAHRALADTVQLVLLVIAMLKAKMEDPGLAEALEGAMISHQESSIWPSVPPSDWVPRSRSSDMSESDEPRAVASSPASRSPGADYSLVLMVFLGLLVLAGVGNAVVWWATK